MSLVRIVAAVIAATLLALGCGAGSLCGRLAGAGSCGASAASECRAALAAQKQETPECAAMLDQLAICLAGLEVSCTSFGVAASGPSGHEPGDKSGGGPDNFSTVGGFDVVVNGACSLAKRGYDACVSCPDAAGAREAGVRGIGEGCTAGAECAAGLRCLGGQCTRECSDDSECAARSKDCRLSVQYGNVCVEVGGGRRCTRSCSSDSFCRFQFGDGYRCERQACVPG